LENFPGAGAIIIRCPFARSRHVVPLLSHQAARFLAIALRPYILFSPSRSFLSLPSAAEQKNDSIVEKSRQTNYTKNRESK